MLSVCHYVKLTALAELRGPHSCSKSFFLAVKPVTPVLFIYYTLEPWTKNKLGLAVETEEERRTRLEAFLKSWQLCLSFQLEVLTT